MEEEFTADQLKGFNAGYALAKYEPELFSKLLPSLEKSNKSEYVQGLKYGKHQADRERLLEQLKQSQERNKSKERGPEL